MVLVAETVPRNGERATHERLGLGVEPLLAERDREQVAHGQQDRAVRADVERLSVQDVARERRRGGVPSRGQAARREDVRGADPHGVVRGQAAVPPPQRLAELLLHGAREPLLAYVALAPRREVDATGALPRARQFGHALWVREPRVAATRAPELDRRRLGRKADDARARRVVGAVGAGSVSAHPRRAVAWSLCVVCLLRGGR